MAWGEKLAKGLGYIVDTAWPSVLAAGVVYAAAGLFTGHASMLVGGVLFAVAGTAMAAACHRAGRKPWIEAGHDRPAETWTVGDAIICVDVEGDVERTAMQFSDRVAASAWLEQSESGTIH